MNKVVCIVGMPGAGKSVVSDELVKHGFGFIRFGQITLDKVIEEGLEASEENERKIREDIRKEYGMGAYAIFNIPKIDKFLEKGSVVCDGLYSWEEYKILKNKYGEKMNVVAVYAPPKTRYSRLENRLVDNDERKRFRSFSKDESKKRDYAEIENIEKGGPIAMADYTIVNTRTIDEVKDEIEKILEDINKY